MTQNEWKILQYCYQLDKDKSLYQHHFKKIVLQLHEREISYLVKELELTGFLKSKGLLFKSYILTEKGKNAVRAWETRKKSEASFEKIAPIPIEWSQKQEKNIEITFTKEQEMERDR